MLRRLLGVHKAEESWQRCLPGPRAKLAHGTARILFTHGLDERRFVRFFAIIVGGLKDRNGLKSRQGNSGSQLCC